MSDARGGEDGIGRARQRAADVHRVCRTKPPKTWADMLNAEGVVTASLHGGRTQGEREAALKDFTRGLCSVLVATDVAARGLDVKGVQHVEHGLAEELQDYVHRIGRIGRNGMTGRATSFYTDSDAFIVSQIKRALQELESGNAFAFATGKEARAKEKEAQRAWREEPSADQSKTETDSGGIISVDDKFKSMLVTSANAGGNQPAPPTTPGEATKTTFNKSPPSPRDDVIRVSHHIPSR